MKKFLLFVIPFSLLTTIRLDAQVWTNYTTANSGLSYNQVLSVAVDGTGIKWFGTNGGGVNKFDGTNWTAFRKSNSGISDNYIYVVKPDNLGTCWIGNNSGLTEFDGVNWTNYTNNGSNNFTVYAMDFDAQGNKWLGASSYQAFDGIISKFDGINFTNYTKANGIGFSSVNAVAKDAQGNMWFGSIEGRVFSFNGSAWTDYNDAIYNATGDSPGFISAIAADTLGNIWIGADKGVYKKNGGVWTIYNTTNSGLCYNNVYSIAIDQQAHVWFGTGNGVSEFYGTTWTTYTTTDGLVNNTVYAIAIDLQDNKWFAAKEGVSWFHNNTAIDENPKETLTLYPNPASNFLICEITGPAYSLKNIEVFNSLGKIVYETQDAANKTMIKVENNPAGFYFVKLTTNTTVHIARFCKK